MGSKTCMNASCATTTTLEWKKGWALRSGGFADLCYRCGSAYENSLFCDTFHLEQSGWRECYLCSKRLHCGCIASKFLVELLDYGGVGCTTCANCYRLNLNKRSENPDVFGRLTIQTLADSQPTSGQSRIVGNNIDGGRLSQLCQIVEANEPDLFPQSHRADSQTLPGGAKREDFHHGLAKILKPKSTRSTLDIVDMHESFSQPSLSMSLAVIPSGPSLSNGVLDGKEQNNASPSPNVQQPCSILPRLSKSAAATPSGTHTLRARPPVEGRGKNNLLPRYWPRITDQELQQISGNLNSNIIPLFEKVLSASDAGRIGRLVLPKACAEAYFPPINQSEGIPLRIQDVKGKEWTFQFRFWPNNNSRMYVLEGVTPCIQSMQLQAGDTVTFSRIDPSGKLVMGFRKAANVGEQQGLQTSGNTNGVSAEDTSSSGVVENPFSTNCSPGLLQMPKEMKGMSEHLSPLHGDIRLHKIENNGGRACDNSPHVRDRKRTRNIGTKNKRLLLHNEEAMELRLTWEEAQDLLRPALSAKPTIVIIEEHEFEEYDEPPVFGKKTLFTSRLSSGLDQWAQCDDCSKWRRLPMDALLPPRWTCSDNVWDGGRCSCSASEEMSLKEVENFLRVGKEAKKRNEEEATGLEALASAAVLGEATTTRHPRHRAGCTCIVCIQPPSGKGKHKPNCSCNVCMTVKRRFKTLMQRKKKRQMEREIGEEENEKKKKKQRRRKKESGESSRGCIDLNSDPSHNSRGEVAEEEEGEEGGHPDRDPIPRGRQVLVGEG